MKKKLSGRLREKFSDSFVLPEELTQERAELYLSGRQRLRLDNHRGIVEYGAERIRISVLGGEICVEGKSLTIDAADPQTLLLLGEIARISIDGEV